MDHGLSLVQWISQLSLQIPLFGFELCLMLLLAIWKQKNDMVWKNSSSIPPQEVVLRAKGWLREFQQWHKEAAKKAGGEVQQWQKPEVGWVKCNFDGGMESKWATMGFWGGNLQSFKGVFGCFCRSY